MNKVFSLLVAVVFMLMCSTAYAINLDLGVEGDFIVKQDVEADNLNDVIDNLDYSSQNYDVTLAVPIGEYLVLTPKAGLTTSQLKATIDNTDVELNSGVGFNLGADALVKAYQGIVDVSLIGSYRYTRVDIDDIDINGLSISNPIETILTTHEYELGARVSKDLSELGIPITPYVGVVYSDLMGELDVNLSVAHLTEDIDAEKNIGLRLGLIGNPMENVSIAIEGSLIDKQAIAGKVSYRF